MKERMRVVLVEERGGVEKMKIVEQAKPEPGAGMLRVRVEAAGLNFADLMQREGRYPTVLPVPYVPGHEVAGVVDAVGDGVQGIAEGDRVAAVTPQGGYAEYACVGAEQAFVVPTGVDSAAATALLIQGFTAQLLVSQLVRAGEAVLVTAAAGGVGAIAIQLARIREAGEVVGAVGSTDKAALVRELGAHAVTYDHLGWEDEANEAVGEGGFGSIIDAIGGPVRDAAYRVLAPFGRMGIYGNSGQAEERWDADRWHALLMANQSIHGFAVTSHIAAHPGFAAEAFAFLADAAADGRLALPVHPAYRLEDARQAHLDVDARRTTGKVVLQP